MNEEVTEQDEKPQTGEGSPAEAGVVDQQDAVRSETPARQRQEVASDAGDPEAPGSFVNDSEADDVPEPNEPG